METTYLHVHHMSTPTGECLEIDCPHCGKRIHLMARTLADGDTVVLEYAEELLDDKNDLS
jgi:hypothetical protein